MNPDSQYYTGYRDGRENGYNEARNHFAELIDYYKKQIEFLNNAIINLKTSERLNNDSMSVLPADDT